MGVRKLPLYEGGTSHGDVTTFEEGVGDWPFPSRMRMADRSRDGPQRADHHHVL
jgi:hypothetical protein